MSLHSALIKNLNFSQKQLKAINEYTLLHKSTPLNCYNCMFFPNFKTLWCLLNISQVASRLNPNLKLQRNAKSDCFRQTCKLTLKQKMTLKVQIFEVFISPWTPNFGQSSSLLMPPPTKFPTLTLMIFVLIWSTCILGIGMVASCQIS